MGVLRDVLEFGRTPDGALFRYFRDLLLPFNFSLQTVLTSSFACLRAGGLKEIMTLPARVLRSELRYLFLHVSDLSVTRGICRKSGGVIDRVSGNAAEAYI